MPFSQARLTSTVVLIRVFTGAVFTVVGWSKIASFEFARFDFPGSLARASRGGAPGWYADLLRDVAGPNPGKVAVLLGFLQLAVGIGLLLGLAVRPMCALGIFYVLNVILATWNQGGPTHPVSEWLNYQMAQIFTVCLLVLLAVSHAGEHWGLGAVYHRRRLRWEGEHSDLRRGPSEEFDEE